MRIGKKRFLLYSILVVILVSLCGCSQEDSEGNKTVKVSKFTDLIFQEDELVPNPDFSWNITTDDFVSKVYRGDIFNPESDTFDEYRYYHSDETGITTFTPLITYDIEKFPDDADVMFVFDENGLVRSGYSWILADTKTKDIEDLVSRLTEDMNSNSNVVPISLELPDLSKIERPYQCKWSLVAEGDSYIQLTISHIKNSNTISISVYK